MARCRLSHLDRYRSICKKHKKTIVAAADITASACTICWEEIKETGPSPCRSLCFTEFLLPERFTAHPLTLWFAQPHGIPTQACTGQ
jgi:hypothetical protein